MLLSDLKLNDKNPRFIKDDKFKKLVKSIEEFPKMLSLRPIIYDHETLEILGGNMRYRALKALGYKEIPNEWCKSADELTDEEKKRFIIEDNVGFGEWDYELLSNEWDGGMLNDWGLDLSVFEQQDIEEVNKFNETVNFTIKCDSIAELEQLQTKLNVSSQKISYKDFLIKVGL